MKKKLGQNFLIDTNIKKKIVKILNIKKTDVIVEIGPGDGELSESILNASAVFLVELDSDLIPLLKNKITTNNVKIYNENFLKFNLIDIKKKYKSIRLIGNIPYNITGKIISNIIKFRHLFLDIHIIIQKEIYDKIKLKTSSTLNLILNYNFEIEKKFDIKASSFFPKPKVTSSFIKIKNKKKKKYLLNYSFFEKSLKLFFIHKRKKIKNVNYKLTKFININKRPENLTLDDFIRLINLIYITRENKKLGQKGLTKKLQI